MKLKLLIATMIALNLSCISFAQSSTARVQGTISQTTPSSVMIKLRPNETFSAQITNLQLVLQIPNTIMPQPTVTIKSNPFGSATPALNFVATAAYNTEVSDEGGFYNYLFAAVTSQAPFYNFTTNTEIDALELQIAGVGTTSVRLAQLPDGGATGQKNFYVELGNDNTNQTSMFYGSGATNNPLGYSAYSFVPLAGIVLPVKFTAFSATKRDNDGLLNFVVENETANTEKYEVERSLDGTTFDKINTLAAIKNGAASNVYNVVDANLANTKNNGIIYYRIKQIDADGKTAYTDIKSIQMVDKGGLSAFPNPAQDYTNVRIDVLENTAITLTLVNADGKQVMTKILQAQKGTNLTKLDMSPLAAGNYLIKAMVGAELKTISVIKL